MQNKTTLKRILQSCRNSFMILGLSICCISLNAQTVSTSGGLNYQGNLSISNANPLNVSFVLQNTTAVPVVLTNVSTQMGVFAPISVAGDPSVAKLFVSSTSLSGAYDYSTAAWTQIGSGNAVVPANLTVVPVITSVNYVIPAGAQLRFVLELSKGLRISSTLAGDPLPTPNVFSVGGINLQLGNFQIGGLNIGFGGVAPTAPAGNTPVFFGGSVTLSPAVACSGTPTPGNTVSTASSVCPATPFTLSVSAPAAPGTTGLTYQWQSSATGTPGSFVNIAGAQSATYTTTQSASTFYQVVVSCGASFGTSTPVQVAANPPSSCYCAAGANFTTDEKISNVTLNTINNTTTSTAGYENFTALSTLLNPGQPYPLSVSVSQAFASDQVIVWIDYNQNGVFTDPGERVYTSPAGFPVVAPATVTTTIIVPFTALPGTTRMRVRMHDTAFGPNATSCGNSDYGQVEDYTVNILPVVPCTGTPTPGNTLSSASTICSGTNFTLSLQNFTSGSGITYQWQSSATGAAGSFTNIAGATNVTLTRTQTAATFYQAVVTCGANSGTSTPVQVLQSPFVNCYCTSAATSNVDEDIFNVSLGTLNNSSICTSVGPGPGSINRRYANYKSGTGAPAAPEVFLGTSMPFSVGIGTCGGNFANSTAAWIDFNQDGVFATTERVYVSPNAITGPHTETGFVNIPANALQGITGMRVINVEISTPNSVQPCATYTWGETEDYLVNIVPCVPVVLTQQPVDRSVVCGGNTTFSVAATGSLPSFSWQYKTSASATSWINVPNSAPYSGVNTATLTITNASAALNGYVYRAVFSGVCAAVNFSNSATLTITPLITTVTPASATICLGSIQQLSITNTVATAVTATFAATGLPVAIPDGTFPVTTSTAIPFTVSGIPAGSVIQNIGIRFSITHPYVGDLVMNLNAPNNEKLNLFARLNGGAGTNGTANFTNTTIDSISTTVLSGAAAPRSGSYAAEKFAITNANFGDLMVSNRSWSALLGTINGTWNIKIADIGATDEGSVTAASLFITYTAPDFAQGTWTTTRPGTIFTDAAATIPYTGTPATTVYVKPDTSGVVNYSVSFVTPTCQSSVTTIPITVRSLPATFTAPVNRVICQGANTTFTSTTSDGNASSIVWQVSTDNGATYTNLTNGGVYSGATTNTLTITGAGVALNGNRYRLSATAIPCAGTSNSAAATLTVNPTPVIVVTANPLTAIYPGQTTTLSAAVSPNPGATYTWFRDGVLVTGATGSSLMVDVDKLGLYTVRVIDDKGCSATSAGLRISAAANDLLFIYPSPNTGQFQVRFFSQLLGSPYPRTVSVFDSKGSRVYTRAYSITSAYTRLDVDLNNHPKGIYSVELTDQRGVRLKTGRVLIL